MCLHGEEVRSGNGFLNLCTCVHGCACASMQLWHLIALGTTLHLAAFAMSSARFNLFCHHLHSHLSMTGVSESPRMHHHIVRPFTKGFPDAGAWR